jgi:hypothetical protein
MLIKYQWDQSKKPTSHRDLNMSPGGRRHWLLRSEAIVPMVPGVPLPVLEIWVDLEVGRRLPRWLPVAFVTRSCEQDNETNL